MSCQLVAFLLACLITILLIGFIYVFSWGYHRESKEAVILRTIGISSAIFISLIILLVTGFIEAEALKPTLSLSPSLLFETIFVPLALTVILFIGPIVDKYQNDCLFILDPSETLPNHTLLRNYIIGPLLEEYAYRFLLTTLLIKCYSISSTILISSALFSLSHAHHHIKTLFYDGDLMDWAIFGCHLLQTFVFACYACCIYLRVQSVLALFLVHSFCNWMGAPRINRIFAKKYLLILTVTGLVSCIYFLSVFVVT